MNEKQKLKQRREQFSKALRSTRREMLNATCPYCQGDVMDQLDKAAHDWGGYGPPESRTIECPNCKRIIGFELGWETFLCWAWPLVEEPEP